MSEKVEGKPLVVDRVGAEMLKRGVAIQSWVSHMVIAPPLIVEEADLDFGVEALDAALAIADGEVA
jgi:taurine--2-oxoglutarate transaminase